METASGGVTLVNLILCLVVGLRLLRLGHATGGLPERTLATYFLMSAFLACIPMLVVYGSLGRDELVLSESLIQVLLGAAAAGMAIGAVGILLFTRHTFRPASGWARVGLITGCAALGVGFAVEGWTEGFRLILFPGAGHWIGWAGRTGAMLWVAIESFLYFVRLRRRARIGLADPVLVNRFLLWAIWSTTAFCNFAADLAARSVYAWLAGTTTEIVMEAVRPVVVTTIFVTMALGIVSAATLFLTFFAPSRYRSWLERGAHSEATG